MDTNAEQMLQEIARTVLDANSYMVLGTVEGDGSARVSPVYFNHHRYRDLYWVSTPDSTHSGNLSRDPRVSIVVFDSTAPSEETQAVYLTGSAAEVPSDQLEQACAVAFVHVGPGADAFTVEELSGDAPFRLYRATIASAEAHIRGGDSPWGPGHDRRLPVSLA